MAIDGLVIIQTAASLATAVGVGITALQLWYTRKQAVTTFEDELTIQYRGIIEKLPVKALLNMPLTPQEMEGALPAFYLYIDLCNQQIFLWQQKRIRDKTFHDWIDGMEQHLRQPAFAEAWRQIDGCVPQRFEELRPYAKAWCANVQLPNTLVPQSVTQSLVVSQPLTQPTTHPAVAAQVAIQQLGAKSATNP